MCPDEELLSSFFDGEVPSPWKERIELHLSSCPDCSRKLRRFGELRATLAEAVSPEEEQLLAAAAARIGQSVDFGAFGLKRGERAPLLHLDKVWSKKVALSIPLLTAGAAALLLAGLGLGLFRSNQSAGTMASASRTLQPQQVSLESMAQYLKQTSLQPVMIDVPSESTFSQYGNPVIVSFEEPSVQNITTTSEGSQR